ncbi:recombinase family protein [Clostridium estertheticum]|uniref:recombinase family protein n=1 Tax=Clostridium estertheticum TaxID=238834 RepID=UPI001C0C00C7|nr:recombinase family protein [Clostridium estertheticum]MBU3072837.1 recombinase family protein [Clostridium estertheticum]MBU3163126.1 recombinase family protein [Clostridium estertheticum]
MKVAYIRVSTEEQKTDRQELTMEALGVDKVYIEKQSGKDKNRPVLIEMMNFLREGDQLIIESISRFSRNIRDLLELTSRLNAKGVIFVSVKENIDTQTATGAFMLTIFGAVAQLERDYLLDRQREGIRIAKSKGVYKGRKKIEVDVNAIKTIYNQLVNKQITATKAMKFLGLKRNTFYRRLKEYENNQVIDY